MSRAVRAAGCILSLAALAAPAPSLPRPGAVCRNFPSGIQLQFGSYNPFTGDRDSTATIAYDCAIPFPPRITITAGSSGTFAERHLTNGGAVLRYNLYTDAGHTQIWGDGTAGSSAVTGPTGPGAAVTIFARIFGGQDVPPSTTPYADGPLTITYAF